MSSSSSCIASCAETYSTPSTGSITAPSGPQQHCRCSLSTVIVAALLSTAPVAGAADSGVTTPRRDLAWSIGRKELELRKLWIAPGARPKDIEFRTIVPEHDSDVVSGAELHSGGGEDGEGEGGTAPPAATTGVPSSASQTPNTEPTAAASPFRPPHAGPTIECRGIKTPAHRGCKVGGLWYDTEQEVFIVDSAPGEASVSGGDQASSRHLAKPFKDLKEVVPEQFEWMANHAVILPFWRPSFKLGFGGSDSAKPRAGSTKTTPGATDTCTVDFPVHLRAPWHPYSFGHMLRDNFHAIVNVPEEFGESAADYAWVYYPRRDEGVKGHIKWWVSGVFRKYAAWVGDPRVMTWPKMMRTHCHKATGIKQPRYIYFPKALVSSGGNNWTLEEHCTNSNFTRMRDYAYETVGVAHTPTFKQKRPRITMLARTEDENRAFLNVKEAETALRAAFPKAEVHVLFMARDEPDPEKQLEQMSKTTVLVTAIGSAGFRMIYLPDGAQVVLVGQYEGSFKGSDDRTHRVKAVWKEIKHCWGAPQIHFRVRKYEIDSIDEVQISKGRGHFGGTKTGPEEMSDEVRDRWEQQRMWDASVHLDVDRLLKLTGEALEGAGWSAEALGATNTLGPAHPAPAKKARMQLPSIPFARLLGRTAG